MGIWKENWQDTKRHFTEWWNHTGTVLEMWPGTKAGCSVPGEAVADPPSPESIDMQYIDAVWRADHSRALLSTLPSWADNLPIARTDLGPGSLAMYLGSEPKFAEDTVWYSRTIEDPDCPATLAFDPLSKWWKVQETIIRESVARAQGNYLVGCPDLIENLDILASLRGGEELMVDLLIRPEWVMEKLDEIEGAFFDSYNRIYEMIKQEDGGAAFGAFDLWGPGKTVKVQCDVSAMISPDSFERFVVPSLARQCRGLDHTMYHLDGTQAVCHLDHLLDIKELDAVEWTPQAGLEEAGDPRWFPIYRKTLDKGKSLQLWGVYTNEIERIADAIGIKGVYFYLKDVETQDDYVKVIRMLERFGYTY